MNETYTSIYPEQVLRDQFRGARILIVLGQYARLGGAERQALLLGTFLRQTIGADVHALASGGGELVEGLFKERGIASHVLPFPNRSARRLRRALQLGQLTRNLRSLQPQYIIPFIGYNSKVMAYAYRRAGAAYCLWNQRDEGRDLYGSAGERRAMLRVCHIVSNSFEGRDFLCRTFGLSPAEIRIVNNGVPMPSDAGGDEHVAGLNEIDPDVHVVTMLANHTVYKDHATLLRAWERVDAHWNSSGFRAALVLAGRAGATTDALKVQAFDAKLGRSVYFPGRIEQTDALLRRSDLLVHSSYREGCPNAVTEAMSHGLPVIATDISGARQALGEACDPVCLSPKGDADDLAAKINVLLEDEQKRRELGRRNRQRVRDHFSVEGMGFAYLSLIQEHLDAQARGQSQAD